MENGKTAWLALLCACTERVFCTQHMVPWLMWPWVTVQILQSELHKPRSELLGNKCFHGKHIWQDFAAPAATGDPLPTLQNWCAMPLSPQFQHLLQQHILMPGCSLLGEDQPLFSTTTVLHVIYSSFSSCLDCGLPVSSQGLPLCLIFSSLHSGDPHPPPTQPAWGRPLRWM